MSPEEKKSKKHSGKKEDKAKKLQEELASCEKERDEYLKGWQRAKADFMNYKNGEEERFELHDRREKEGLMRDLAVVLDSFELGILMSEGETVEKRGVELIKNQLADALKRRGFEKIEVNPGDEFDPNIHEAVDRVDSDLPPDKIVEEAEKGYLFKGKVLKPARVKISRGKNN